MSKKSQEYWKKRAQNRLVNSEQKAQISNADILKIYQRAQRSIERQIKQFYDSYAIDGILDKKEIKDALLPDARKTFLKEIGPSIQKLGLDEKEIYDERYLYKLTRLEALQEQIRMEIYSIAPSEVDISQKTYANVLDQAYTELQGDLSLQGITPSFTTLDTKVVEVILRSKWIGNQNYSSRIWGNLDTFSEDFHTAIGSALLTGQSYQKTAKYLRERFQVSKYQATRLVVTETNYFHNQAELQSYIDDGASMYGWETALEPCPECKAVADAGPYRVEDAIPGKNYPTLHPFDRCTTYIIFDSEINAKPRTFKQRTKRLEVGPTNQEIASSYIKKITA